MNPSLFPRYDRRQTYDWNYDHFPQPLEVSEPLVPGSWNYCGLPAASPLGIAAGPLLNGGWILYYASLGFDILTYKTVRSRARACYPLPNLQPVAEAALRDTGRVLSVAQEMGGSWAVSFGMPSRSPERWRADLEKTREKLPKNKILSLSVVATPEETWGLEEVAADFALCARWGIESGADCIEANFSCPNVASADGQLYQQPRDAGVVAEAIRAAIGSRPLLLKIGHVSDQARAAGLLNAVSPWADGLVMVNCISATVVDADQRRLFEGQKRGIGGTAIRDAALDQVGLFAKIIRQENLKTRLVGVGGIATAQDVRDYLEAGSQAVQLATSAMVDPSVGLAIRAGLPEKIPSFNP